jgi:hypothetical protein
MSADPADNHGGVPGRRTPHITGCNFYAIGSDHSFLAHSDQFHVFEEHVGRCQVFIFVWRDFSRVFVGGGEWGYGWTAREADTLEIEALAERFEYPELRRVVQLRTQQALSPA